MKEIKRYFKNLLSAILGNYRKWNVIYIGQNGIKHLTFEFNSFKMYQNICIKSENRSLENNGPINDEYSLAVFDKNELLAVYVKIIDNSESI